MAFLSHPLGGAEGQQIAVKMALQLTSTANRRVYVMCPVSGRNSVWIKSRAGD